MSWWNVHNIKSSVLNKAEEQQFIKAVLSYDIFCTQETKNDDIFFIDKVSKGAKIRNRYNQVPHLT